jgi:hypothetical protein
VSFSTCCFCEFKKTIKEWFDKTSGITCLQKHLDANHSTIYTKFQEEINNQGKKMLKDNLQIKGFLFPILPYLNFFFKRSLQKG